MSSPAVKAVVFCSTPRYCHCTCACVRVVVRVCVRASGSGGAGKPAFETLGFCSEAVVPRSTPESKPNRNNCEDREGDIVAGPLGRRLAGARDFSSIRCVDSLTIAWAGGAKHSAAAATQLRAADNFHCSSSRNTDVSAAQNGLSQISASSSCCTVAAAASAAAAAAGRSDCPASLCGRGGHHVTAETLAGHSH